MGNETSSKSYQKHRTDTVAPERLKIILDKDYSKFVPFTKDMHSPWRKGYDEAIKSRCNGIAVYNDIAFTTYGKGVWICRMYNNFYDDKGIKFIRSVQVSKYKLRFTKFHDCVFQVSLLVRNKNYQNYNINDGFQLEGDKVTKKQPVKRR